MRDETVPFTLINRIFLLRIQCLAKYATSLSFGVYSSRRRERSRSLHVLHMLRLVRAIAVATRCVCAASE